MLEGMWGPKTTCVSAFLRNDLVDPFLVPIWYSKDFAGIFMVRSSARLFGLGKRYDEFENSSKTTSLCIFFAANWQLEILAQPLILPTWIYFNTLHLEKVTDHWRMTAHCFTNPFISLNRTQFDPTLIWVCPSIERYLSGFSLHNPPPAGFLRAFPKIMWRFPKMGLPLNHPFS